MSSQLPVRNSTGLTPAVSFRASRALARIEDRALVRSAEIQAVTFVAHTALRGVTEVSMAEDELAKVCPPDARLRLAAVGDAATMAIQSRVLDLIEGL